MSDMKKFLADARLPVALDFRTLHRDTSFDIELGPALTNTSKPKGIVKIAFDDLVCTVTIVNQHGEQIVREELFDIRDHANGDDDEVPF